MMSSATTESSCRNQYWFNSASSWRRSGRKYWRDMDRRSTELYTPKAIFYPNWKSSHTGTKASNLFLIFVLLFIILPRICPRGELPVCGLFPIHTKPQSSPWYCSLKFIPIIKFIYNKTFMTIKDEYSLTIFEYKVAVQISENHLSSLIHL